MKSHICQIFNLWLILIQTVIAKKSINANDAVTPAGDILQREETGK